MNSDRDRTFTAPVFVGVAFLILGVAIVEKVLNLFGTNIPFVPVFPRQLLNWAATLLVFDIALTLRQMLEAQLGGRGSP